MEVRGLCHRLEDFEAPPMLQRGNASARRRGLGRIDVGKDDARLRAAFGDKRMLPGRDFSYSASVIVAANLFCASVTYMHEKTSRMRFLEACLLRELVARDGLTGIQNRRMFDQHITRVWQQAVREEERKKAKEAVENGP